MKIMWYRVLSKYSLPRIPQRDWGENGGIFKTAVMGVTYIT